MPKQIPTKAGIQKRPLFGRPVCPWRHAAVSVGVRSCCNRSRNSGCQPRRTSSANICKEPRVINCSTNIDTPKGRKGKNTSRTIALSPGSVVDLNLWKSHLGESHDSAYLFCSETGTSPLRPNNHWKRNILPRLERIGLGWVNYHVLRRTNASLSRKAKIDDKVSADQRGHGLGVSLGVYAY